MAGTRADPFADDTLDDLSDFAPKAAPKPRPAVDAKAVREVAEQQGFKSREERQVPPAAAPRRQRGRARTDRTEQLNMKVRKETLDRFLRLADKHGVLYGDLLDRAMDALERMR